MQKTKFNFSAFSQVKKKSISKKFWLVSALGSIGVLALALFFVFYLTAPKALTEAEYFSVSYGDSLLQLSTRAQEEGVIRSAFLFQSLAILRGAEKKIVAGDYDISDRPNLLEFLDRLVTGEYGDAAISVRLPEGGTVRDFADILEKQIPKFDKDQFIRKFDDDEGYVFPDTYMFFPSSDTSEIISKIEETFIEKTADLKVEAELAGKDFEDIVIMASIIEREANRNQMERKIISGILWKRMSKGIALQVDAPFVYILGKGSAQLTKADLATDHPYNTYKNLGLPPGPISNPSLGSIEAALYPETSPFYYYLHGADGTVRYAETFEGHKENKRLYLD